MVLKETFNAGRGEVAGQPEMGATPLDPYASNVHLSGLSAIQLAGLELAGVILPRLTGGAAGIIGPDGRRQKADSVAAQESAILQAMNATAQARQKWDAQLVNVGGTMMSNAEIRDMVQRIADNPDPYVEYALAEGLIKEGEQQAFLDGIERMKELEPKIADGTASEAETAEFEGLRESYLETAAAAHAALKAHHKSLALQGDSAQIAGAIGMAADFSERYVTLAAMSVGGDVDDQPFGHVPPLTPAFAAGLKATEPLDRADDPPRPAEPDPALAASGFDF